MQESNEILMYGRFGEEIHFSQDQKEGYVVSCREIGMDPCHMSKQEFADFERRYVKEGVPDFDKDDPETIKSRAVHMGRWVRRCYVFLKCPSDEEILINCAWIYQTMIDALALGLTEKHYVDWFILQDCQTPLSDRDKEYLNTLLSLKRRAVDRYVKK